MTYLIGCHVNKIKESFLKTVQYAKKNGVHTLQMFVTNPRSTRSIYIGPKKGTEERRTWKEDIENARKFIIKNKMNLIIHGSYGLYLNKLCGSPKLTHRCINEMKIAIKLGACVYNIHDNKGIARPNFNLSEMRNKMAELVKTVDYGIILAIEQDAHGLNLDNLYNLMCDVQTKYKPYCKLCIDTAHSWARSEILNGQLTQLTRLKKYIIMIHLNGSIARYGSYSDKHGTIFGQNNNIDSGELVKIARMFSKTIPVILETKPINTRLKEINTLRNKIKK